MTFPAVQLSPAHLPPLRRQKPVRSADALGETRHTRKRYNIDPVRPSRIRPIPIQDQQCSPSNRSSYLLHPSPRCFSPEQQRGNKQTLSMRCTKRLCLSLTKMTQFLHLIDLFFYNILIQILWCSVAEADAC